MTWVQLTVILAVCLGAHSGHGQSQQDIDRVQQDVKAISLATYSADVDGVLRYTHPTVIKMLGGMEAARRTLQETSVKFKSVGLRLESLMFPRPPEFLDGGGRRFAVVPTLSIISASGQRVESLNFLLGVVEPNTSQWTYVDGSRINKAIVQKLFPGFPASYEFPATYRKKL